MDDFLRNPRLNVPNVVTDDQLKRGDPFNESTFSQQFRHQVFSGFLPNDTIDERIRLRSLPAPESITGCSTSFDIDSIIGSLSHLGKLRSALKILTIQTSIPQAKSSLHLKSFPVRSQSEARQREPPIHSRPLYKIPQIVLRRLTNYDNFQVTVLFPSAVQPKQQTTRLSDKWYDIQLDHILLPALYDTIPTTYTSTFPTSAKDARLKSTLKSRQTRIQNTYHQPRQQLLSYFIPAQYLSALQKRVLRNITSSLYEIFNDAWLLVVAKEIKSIYRDT